jgi:hypothetical protein
MKKLITLFAIAGMVLALAPAAQAAPITLMANGTNDGSFEAYTASGVNWGGSVGVWQFNGPTAPNRLGAWNGTPTGRDGLIGLVANGGDLGVGTTSDILGTGGYSTVTVGDVFTWSYIYNDGADTNQTVGLSLNFGGADVVVDSFTMDSPVNWQTRSGTYTATSTDAGGGSLSVVATVGGHTFTDKYELSVVAIPEPATMSLLAIGGIALIRRRRRA